MSDRRLEEACGLQPAWLAARRVVVQAIELRSLARLAAGIPRAVVKVEILGLYEQGVLHDEECEALIGRLELRSA